MISALQEAGIRGKLAWQQKAIDHLDDALETCDTAIERARERCAGSEEVEAGFDLLGREILLSSGRSEGVFEKRRLPGGGWASPKPELPVWTTAAWFLKAEARLAQLDPHTALNIHREARELRRKAVRAGAAHLDLLPEKPQERRAAGPNRRRPHGLPPRP